MAQAQLNLVKFPEKTMEFYQLKADEEQLRKFAEENKLIKTCDQSSTCQKCGGPVVKTTR